MIAGILRAMTDEDWHENDPYTNDPELRKAIEELKPTDPVRYEMNRLLFEASKQEDLPAFVFAPIGDDDTDDVAFRNAGPVAVGNRGGHGLGKLAVGQHARFRQFSRPTGLACGQPGYRGE